MESGPAGHGDEAGGDEGAKERAQADDLVGFAEVVAGAEEFDVGGGDAGAAAAEGDIMVKCRLSIAPHRTHLPPSRFQTSTLTTVGTWREIESSCWSSALRAVGVAVGRR